MEITTEKLKLLGIPDMQARVYLASLELGSATLQAISKKSRVNRSTIYTFIEEMKENGLLQETNKGQRKVYSAISPGTILQREQERVKQLEQLIPELDAINNKRVLKPKVTYFEGMDGIEEVYKDMLKEKKEIFAYEDIEHLHKGLSEKIYNWFPQARASKSISIKSISRDSEKAREFSKRNFGLLRDNKYIQVDDLKTDINIYGNKVALMDLRSKPSFCVLIENEHLARTMRTLWFQLWNKLEGDE